MTVNPESTPLEQKCNGESVDAAAPAAALPFFRGCAVAVVSHDDKMMTRSREIIIHSVLGI